MKTNNWLVAFFFAVAMFSADAFAGGDKPSPWPFPWAKDCPLDWESMTGRYQLADSTRRDELDLIISVEDRNGMRLVRISYMSAGDLVSEGRAMLKDDQNSIGMYLVSNKKDAPLTWAVIKLFYRTAELRCGKDNVVPILTMETPENNVIKTSRYRMVKVEKRVKK